VEVAREYPEKSCREIARQLCRTMQAEDVRNSLDMAIAETGVDHVQVVQGPRLFSDNRACFISHELKKYLEVHEIPHIRTKVYHPMTQGKIERYHRSMKNLILLDNDYAPAELTARIREWVDYDNASSLAKRHQLNYHKRRNP
jgi:putative transposase